MTPLAPDTTPPDATLAGLEPLRAVRSRWPAIIGAVLTVLMIAGLARELFGDGLAGLTRSVPQDPRFYLCFALLYMSPPTGDFLIFRRLWGIPIAGLAALIKKRIANEVVFGYSGEAYFYAWARARTTLVAAPFGAVKDVSILSAIAGNAITLLMIAVALPHTHQAVGEILKAATAEPTRAIAITIRTFLRKAYLRALTAAAVLVSNRRRREALRGIGAGASSSASSPSAAGSRPDESSTYS